MPHTGPGRCIHWFQSVQRKNGAGEAGRYVCDHVEQNEPEKTGAGGHVLCPGGVQRAAGALHQHPHGDGCGVGEQDRERTGHPDLVHRLRAGGGRCVHHRRQSQNPPQMGRQLFRLQWGGAAERHGSDPLQGQNGGKMDGPDPGGQQRRDPAATGCCWCGAKRLWEPTCWSGPPAWWWV